jgi:hypothetical protein
MKLLFYRMFTMVVCVALLTHILPCRSAAATATLTSDSRSRRPTGVVASHNFDHRSVGLMSGPGVGNVSDPAYRPLAFAALASGVAVSDTTAFEFPGEEDDHLVRDVTVFLIISAFVGYFLVKVFFSGDEEEVPDTGGGKEIPF